MNDLPLLLILSWPIIINIIIGLKSSSSGVNRILRFALYATIISFIGAYFSGYVLGTICTIDGGKPCTPNLPGVLKVLPIFIGPSFILMYLGVFIRKLLSKSKPRK